jgi:hypothetical protein
MCSPRCRFLRLKLGMNSSLPFMDSSRLPLYDLGFSTRPQNSTVLVRLSLIMNRKGRSALKSFGSGLRLFSRNRKPVAAAASVPSSLTSTKASWTISSICTPGFSSVMPLKSAWALKASAAPRSDNTGFSANCASSLKRGSETTTLPQNGVVAFRIGHVVVESQPEGQPCAC